MFLIPWFTKYIYIFILKITLPNGATLSYEFDLYWLYDIKLSPSIFDEDNVEGLCGNPNNDSTDDFTLQESSSTTVNETVFQASWRFFFSCFF